MLSIPLLYVVMGLIVVFMAVFILIMAIALPFMALSGRLEREMFSVKNP